MLGLCIRPQRTTEIVYVHLRYLNWVKTCLTQDVVEKPIVACTSILLVLLDSRQCFHHYFKLDPLN